MEAHGRDRWVEYLGEGKARRGSADWLRVTPRRIGTDLPGAQIPGAAAHDSESAARTLRRTDGDGRIRVKRQEGQAGRETRGYREGKPSESESPRALPA